MAHPFNREILEAMDIVPAFLPVDMQTAANNGIWINMQKVIRLACVLYKKAGTAGDDPVFTLNQATDNAGTSSKALTFTRARTKIGTIASNSSPVATWTLATQAAANTYTPTSAASQALIVVEIRPEDLDMANGFNHVQLAIPDTGSNAQLGCAFYLAVHKYEGASTLSLLD